MYIRNTIIASKQAAIQRLLDEVQQCKSIVESFQKCMLMIIKFCVRSAYGNIQSLQQKGRIKDILDSVNINKSNINNYKNYSLDALQNMIINNNKLGDKVLRHREEQITNDLIKYQQTQKKIHHYKNHPELTSNQQMQTSFARNIKEEQDYHEYTSPPSYLPQETIKKTKQSHAKQQQMLKNMSQKERVWYAEQKLKQLQQIKLTYIQNNGNDRKFLNNLNNLEEFYRGLKLGVDKKESRLKTPIAQLKDFEQSKIEKPRLRTSEIRPLVEENKYVSQRSNYGSRVLNQGTIQKKPNQLGIISNPYENHPQQIQNYPQQYQVPPMPYGSTQPIIIMPPPYYPPPTYSDYHRQPERNHINETNLMNRLEQLLKQKEQGSIVVPFKSNQVASNEMKQLNRTSNVSNNNNNKSNTNKTAYLVQKFNNGLLPEERVLEALQRQEYQQLRMLSNLPPDLQKVKMDIIKQTTQLRSQVQKQIHQQRVLRMRHQLQMQQDHQQQMYQDQIWVDKQRKQQVSQKLIRDYQKQE